MAQRPANVRALALDPRTRRVDPDRLRRLEALVPAEQQAFGIALRLQTHTIVVLALNEGVAVLGVILSLLTRTPAAILPFALAATVLNLFVFPRPAAVAGRMLR